MKGQTEKSTEEEEELMIKNCNISDIKAASSME